MSADLGKGNNRNIQSKENSAQDGQRNQPIQQQNHRLSAEFPKNKAFLFGLLSLLLSVLFLFLFCMFPVLFIVLPFIRSFFPSLALISFLLPPLAIIFGILAIIKSSKAKRLGRSTSQTRADTVMGIIGLAVSVISILSIPIMSIIFIR